MKRSIITLHKRKMLPILAAIAIFAAIGTTFAFYGDTFRVDNPFQLGASEEVYTESFKSPEDWTPCTETPKTATATNKNDTPRYARMKYNDYWRIKNSQTSDEDHTTSDLPLSWTDENHITHRYTFINLQNEDDWVLATDGWYYYKTALQKDQTTNSLLKSVTFNCEVNLVGEMRYSADGKTAESIPSDYADANYHVYVTFEMSSEEYEYDEQPQVVVARIERTGKLYDSIASAEAAAQNGDTITLLTDTTETASIAKTVTLDLNEHVVTGSIINAGNLTLLNGEINNPDGVALVNNGTLTIGIDDHGADEKPTIVSDYVRIIGTTTGLKQNGVFNYYDGFIEGDIALEGGYDDSPFYVNPVYGNIIRYIALVDHNYIKDCQHVELSEPNNAITKTIDNGEVYYYNLQDNINTSIVTGYKIYAIDNFSAQYTVTVPENTSIVFDLAGFDVSIEDDVTNNGSFTIEDSHTTSSTVANPDGIYAMPNVNGKVFTAPHDTDKTITTYGGSLSVQQTIQNNGTLAVKNALIKGVTGNNTIRSSGTINLQSGAIGSVSGTVMNPVSGANYIADDNSFIYSTSSNKAPIYNGSINDFVWDTGGNIYSSSYYGIHTDGDTSKSTIKGGTIYSPYSAAYNWYSELVIDGATFKSDAPYWDSRGTISNDRSTTTFKSGKVIVVGKYNDATTATGIYAGTLNMTGGDIIATNNITSSRCVGNVTGANLDGASSITGGTITATAPNINCSSSTAIGVNSRQLDIGGTITIRAHSVNGQAQGVNHSLFNTVINITGGTISGTSDSSFGTGLKGYNTAITGGTISGSTYGVFTNPADDNGTYYTTLGTDDGAISTTTPEIIGEEYGLYSGAAKFYDGVIRSNQSAFDDGVIAATPDGYTTHVESTGSYAENATLTQTPNFLQVGSEQFNSLTAAYNAITGDSGTVQVIANTTVESTLPASPEGKTITFDLNGHEITFTQSLVNSHVMTITDSSAGQTGKLINPSTGNAAVVNNGTLTVDSAKISGYYTAIHNSDTKTLTVTNSTIDSTRRGIYLPHYWGGNYSDVNITNTTINSSHIGIETSYLVNLNLTNTHIIINNTEAADGNGYGIYNGGAKIVIDGDSNNSSSIEVTANATAFGIYGGNYDPITINHATITATASAANSNAAGISSGGSRVNINGATIAASNTSTDNSCSDWTPKYAFGIDANYVTVTGGHISASTSFNAGDCDAANAYGIRSYSEISLSNNPTITSTTVSGASYGIQINTQDGAGATIDGATITATSSDYTAIGANIYTGVITDGTITGDTYGINSRSVNHPVTLGTNDSSLSTTTPEIISKTSDALHGGAFNYYDGVLRGEKAFQAGVITATPDGATYQITETAEYKENCILTATADYLQVGSEQFNSLTDAYNAISGTTGTIQVIANAIVESVLPNSPEGKTITFDLNGFQLEYKQSLPVGFNSELIIVDTSADQTGLLTNNTNNIPTITNGGTLTLNSGTIHGNYHAINVNKASQTNINNGTITSPSTGIYADPNAATDAIISMTGGTINVSNSGAVDTYGISGNAKVTFGGTATINATSKATAIGIADSEITITGGTINSTANLGYTTSYDSSYAYGIRSRRNTTVTGGTITAINTRETSNYCSDSQAYGIYYYPATAYPDNGVNVSGGIIHAETHWNNGICANASAYGINSYRTNISDAAQITANSIYGNSYGVATNTDDNATATISGGTITANSSNGQGYGASLYSAQITDGSIRGSTHGVISGSASKPIAIGNNDGTLDSTAPVIIGKSYGLYGGSFKFYDGVLNGGVNAYQKSVVNEIAPNATIAISSSIIDGDTYETRTIVPAQNVARIGSTNYTSLSDAITAANVGDTITLLSDVFVFDELTISSTKQFTISTDGYDIITGNPIVNNGKLTIVDNSTPNSSILDYYNSRYLITNYEEAELNLTNITINATYAVENHGTMNVANSNIDATNTAVKNSGTTTINDGTLNAGTTPLYNAIGSTSITNAAITNGIIDNNSGQLTLTNTIATKTGEYQNDFLKNSGTLIIDGSTIALTNTSIGWRDASRVFYNNGTATISNHSLVKSTLDQPTSYNQGVIMAVHNEGSITSSDSDIVLDGTTINSNQNVSYALYNPTGTFVLLSGNVLATINNSTTDFYGIYNDSGTVTLGVAESPDSPNYGTANADVSITDPYIKSVHLAAPGTKATGVFNNTGHFNFYDGRITGSMSTMNKEPSNVEYLYIINDTVDADNYPTRTLKFQLN